MGREAARRARRGSRLLAAVATAAGLVTGPASAQELGKVLELRSRVVDLVFRVEDVAGRTQDLRVHETPTEVRIELAADVLFEFDRADIQPKAAAALKEAAAFIRERARGPVRVEGHTDAKGANAYNQKLSERRAQAVAQWLGANEGLKNVRFVTRGFGARNPVAPNSRPDGADDPEGRQRNRRVEIIVRK